MSEAMVASNSTAILVLGMHRSGTSLVAGLLQKSGVYVGETLLPPQDDNPTGFFEPKPVVDLHDAILAQLGTSWDDPRGLPEDWQTRPDIGFLREELRDIIARDFAAQAVWAVKDPRLCLLLPLWVELLGELGITPKLLLVLRNPYEVMASLAKRSSMSAEQAAMLWLTYNVAAERASRGLTRCIVHYEDLLAAGSAELARVAAVLDTKLADDVEKFVDPALRHHKASAPVAFSAPQNGCVDDLYNALLQWRRDGTDPGEVCDAVAAILQEAVQAAAPIVDYLRAPVPSVPNIYLEDSARAERRKQALLHERLLLIKKLQAEITELRNAR